MKLVHFSDLHLDAHFAWLGGANGLARERRQALRDTLQNIVNAAHEVHADAVLCGGDLFEHERVTPDTAEFLLRTLASLHPVRVFIAPGNHDWLGPHSLYKQLAWSPNVHIFDSNRLERVEIEPGLNLWGAAHCAPANTDGFLDSFRVDMDVDAVNLALFHGSERYWLQSEDTGKSPHAPFDEAQIARAGLDFAFLGHYHAPKDTDWLSYPGNPDPLSFGEIGDRGVVIASVSNEGRVTIERRNVAATHTVDLTVDLTGSTNQQDVRNRVTAALADVDGFVRATLQGEVAPEVDVEVADLRPLVTNPRIQLRIGNVSYGYNMEAIRQEQTIRGQFVRDVEAETSLDDDVRRRILVTGLRALEGRKDLEVW